MYARQHRILEALTGALDDYEAGAIDLKQLAEDFNGLLNPPSAGGTAGPAVRGAAGPASAGAAGPASLRTPGLGIEPRIDRTERVERGAGRVVSWVVYSKSGIPASEPERGRVATFFTRTFKRH